MAEVVYNTIQEAKADGVVTGTPVTAPLAPPTGKIIGAPESLVVVTVKTFWESPTIKWARNIIGAAIIAVVGVFANTCLGVWLKGGDIFEAGVVDWHATIVAAEAAGGLIIASAILAYKKTADNNPVK
jgi:hypothetical protein